MLSRFFGSLKNVKNIHHIKHIDKNDSIISLDFVVSVLGLSSGLLMITSK